MPLNSMVAALYIYSIFEHSWCLFCEENKCLLSSLRLKIFLQTTVTTDFTSLEIAESERKIKQLLSHKHVTP